MWEGASAGSWIPEASVPHVQLSWFGSRAGVRLEEQKTNTPSVYIDARSTVKTLFLPAGQLGSMSEHDASLQSIQRPELMVFLEDRLPPMCAGDTYT